MKKILFIFLLLCTGAFSSPGYFQLQCLDSTFSYNAIRVNEVSDGIELSIGGGFHHLPDFVFGIPPIQGFSAFGLGLYIKFDKSRCTSLLDNNIACEALGTEDAPFEVFAKTEARDLGEDLDLLTDVNTYGSKFIFNGTDAVLSLNDPFDVDTENYVKILNIPGLTCEKNGEDVEYPPYFPQRLRDYINESN